MSECRCESCAPDNPAPTCTRSWLRQCLIRYVRALPPLLQEDFFALVRSHQGEAEEQRMRGEV